MGCSKNNFKRDFYNSTILYQEKRKISNKQPNFTCKTTRKRGTNEAQNQQKEKIINIRGEINEIKTKKTITKINETKSQFFEKMKKMGKPIIKPAKRKGTNYSCQD